jgi:hypothetical protein
MKLLSINTYTTTVIHLQYNNESYEITHREDSDSSLGLVPEWEVINEDGEEESRGEVRTAIIEECEIHLGY